MVKDTEWNCWRGPVPSTDGRASWWHWEELLPKLYRPLWDGQTRSSWWVLWVLAAWVLYVVGNNIGLPPPCTDISYPDFIILIVTSCNVHYPTYNYHSSEWHNGQDTIWWFICLMQTRNKYKQYIQWQPQKQNINATKSPLIQWWHLYDYPVWLSSLVETIIYCR